MIVIIATAPAARPVINARLPHWTANSWLLARSASDARNVAARNEHVNTASTPPTHDVGPVQLVHRSPRPSGTRPPAIAPGIMPRKNGVMTDDAANAAP